MESNSSSDSETILRFWFGEEAGDVAIAERQAGLWWGKNPELDRDMRRRFAALLPDPAGAAPDLGQAGARDRLAMIILLDQFPRNIYRGQKEAFAWDGLAQQQARAAYALGDETQLRPIERVFLYMPFEHAENLELQELAVQRFTSLAAAVPTRVRVVFDGYRDYAVRHRDIIARFGRFPHRNAVLSRLSTAEEEDFLRQPGSSF